METDLFFADTNFFLRYLTNDVPEQASAIEQLLHEAIKGEFKLVTNSLVIAEIVWTLEAYYRVAPENVQEKILAILNTPGLELIDADLVLQAILWHVEKSVDFIDTYNAAWMMKQDIKKVFTFDRKHFIRFEGLNVVVPGTE